MLHEYMCAALAQSVERRLGKAEVGGSIPLGSLGTVEKLRNNLTCYVISLQFLIIRDKDLRIFQSIGF